jgi:uncharacterized repeat protein (TIGR03803 family)
MNGGFDELAERLEPAAPQLRALRKFVIVLSSLPLAWGGANIAWADWTPPESSVTPPAVVTLDAFAAWDVKGVYPEAALVLGPDGALYGSTLGGGSNGFGTLFRLEPDGTSTVVHGFTGPDGSGPSAALVVGPDGMLYGSTESGGAYGQGTLFRLQASGSFAKLHDFNGSDGAQPETALVVGPDGALYGSTPKGGSSGAGTLFRVKTNGSFTKLHEFSFIDGAQPATALVVGPDSALYGSTEYGGTNGYDTLNGYGTLFRLETNGAFTKLYDFNGADGIGPNGLVVGLDGALYGSAFRGSSTNGYNTQGNGTLFRLETNGTFAKLHDFDGTNGANPLLAVVRPDGAMYGATYAGGTNTGFGTLFRLEPNGTFTKLHDFSRSDGAGPSAALVVGADGALYGSAQFDGASDFGTLFRVETNGTFAKLHDFNGTDGAQPDTALAVGPDGMLYGSSTAGGGTLFRLETNGNFTKVYDFSSTESYEPSAPLVMGPDGELYGSSLSGGAFGWGSLFRLGASGTFTKLHDFDQTNGAYFFDLGTTPPLVVGPDGALYGSTAYGGRGFGTLFRVRTNGTFTKLHDFNGLDGATPKAALVVGPDGALYGSTPRGGFSSNSVSGNGTLFRLETNGNFTKLHTFNYANSTNDGAGVYAALVMGPDGGLYGSTQYGGTKGYGTLFRLENGGGFTKLHDFDGTSGATPWAALVVGPDGALYGSTYAGGISSSGTLFRVEPNGGFTKLHDFNGTDGTNPSPALVVGPDGALYGSTYAGGISSKGALFRMKTDGTFTKLHDFNGVDGAGPSAALVVGPDGALYGSTRNGGGTNGTLFRVTTNGTFTKLYDFNGTNGVNPLAALVVGPDGALYGTTPNGGPRRGGILFKVVLNRAPVARCHDVTVSAGANCAAEASVDNGSFDPDAGDAITVRQEPPGPYPLGVTPVTLIVTDNHGASNSCAATVTVMDTAPPTISDVAVSPNVLSPPNHKMVEVTVNYAAADDCGGVTNVLVVSSNEAPSDQAPDWVIEDEHHVQLRAERSGAGSGRVYRITVISTDNAGNSSTKSAVVTVPKSQGK